MRIKLFSLILIVICSSALPSLSQDNVASADSLLALAREAAGNDDHENSVGYYKQAIALNPALKIQVATAVGLQFTWWEQPDSAIAWFKTALAANPDDMDAKLGLARALSWGNRLVESDDYYNQLVVQAGPQWREIYVGLARVSSWEGEMEYAERLYNIVLSIDPDYLDAELGLAQITNWNGRHREAESMYRKILSEYPQNAEAIKGLAYAQYWEGQVDDAMQTLRAAPPGADVAATMGVFDRSRKIDGNTTYTFRDNTSDGDFQMLLLSARVPLARQLDLVPRYGKGLLRQNSFPNIDRDVVALTLAKRFSADLAITVTPGYQWNSYDPVTPPGAPTSDSFNLFVWDAFGTWTPRDWMRWDFGNSRQAMQIPQPTFRNIAVVTTNLGVDWRLSPRWTTNAEVLYSTYSDSNARFGAQGHTEYKMPLDLPPRWRDSFLIGGGLQYLNFREQFEHGYFNPDRYVYAYGTLRFINQLTRRFHINVWGRFGYENDTGQEWVTNAAWEGIASYQFTSSLRLRAAYSGGGSRLNNPDGFRSKQAWISLDYLFGR